MYVCYDTGILDTWRGITIGHNGNLYINSNYAIIRRGEFSFTVSSISLKITQATTLAVNEYRTEPFEYQYPSSTEDGLNFPTGMVVVDNTLYICNTGENRIRKIDLN